jgi:hypothetical protein
MSQAKGKDKKRGKAKRKKLTVKKEEVLDQGFTALRAQ